MKKKSNIEMIFFVLALIILVTGVFVTIYTSTPVFDPIEKEGETLSGTNMMQGMVAIEVVGGENQ